MQAIYSDEYADADLSAFGTGATVVVCDGSAFPSASGVNRWSRSRPSRT
jgi:hypothetical protein